MTFFPNIGNQDHLGKPLNKLKILIVIGYFCEVNPTEVQFRFKFSFLFFQYGPYQ